MASNSSSPRASRRHARGASREEKQARRKQLLAEIAALDNDNECALESVLESGYSSDSSISTSASMVETPHPGIPMSDSYSSVDSVGSSVARRWSTSRSSTLDSPTSDKRITIGIGGGVGPMAGCILHQIIIENTIASGDHDHLNVIHLSSSAEVPDRTAFLEGRIKENPAHGMAQVIGSIARCGDLCGSRVIVGVPCNTFHCPQIWGKFECLVSQVPTCSTLHMLQETGMLIHDLVPGITKVGLMSTSGTRRTGVYKDVLKPHGLELIEVPETLQGELHDTIYNPAWGIKAVSPVTAQARDRFVSYVKVLVELGAEAIILGCTEIPLALPEKTMFGVPLVNPMVALGRALVAAAAPEKLKPLSELKGE